MTRHHAIVLGASVGGLLAARALSDFYNAVTIVERDDLTSPGDRRGVPQGRHVHALLARGEELLEEFFPGLSTELRGSGAVDCQALSEMRMSFDGHVLRQGPAGFGVLQASRPFLEWAVRQRVRALPNVTIMDRCAVIDLIADADNSAVTGVRVAPSGSGAQELSADLVVCALGRGAPAGTWLERLGYARPDEEGTPIDMMYASRYVRLPEGSVNGDKEIIVAQRQQGRGMAMFAVEDGRHLLTLIGFGGDFPSRDPDEHLQFAATVAPPDVYAALSAAEPLGTIATYRYKANLRNHYERLDRFPDGFLVFGDAVCSFSPVYGQGMTMSALQAVALQSSLQAGEENLPARFFKAAATSADDAWLLTALIDHGMPHVDAPGTWYLRALDPILAAGLVAAERDHEIARQVARISGLLDPPSYILRPKILLRSAFSLGAALLRLPR